MNPDNASPLGNVFRTLVPAQIIGTTGPMIFGALTGTGTERLPLMIGYLLAAAAVAVGGITMWFFGVDAEGKSLEDVASPLSAAGGKAAAKKPGVHT